MPLHVNHENSLACLRRINYIIPPIPPMPGAPAGIGASGSGMSVMSASVVRIIPAMEAALDTAQTFNAA